MVSRVNSSRPRPTCPPVAADAVKAQLVKGVKADADGSATETKKVLTPEQRKARRAIRIRRRKARQQAQELKQDKYATAKPSDWQKEISLTKRSPLRADVHSATPTADKADPSQSGSFKERLQARLDTMDGTAQARCATESIQERGVLTTGVKTTQKSQAPATTDPATAVDTTPSASYDDVQLSLPQPPNDPNFVAEPWRTCDAIPHVAGESALNKPQDVVAGHKPGEAFMRWDDEAVNQQVAYGQQTGAVTDEIRKDANQTARALVGADKGKPLTGPAVEVTPEAFTQALTQRIPAERLAPTQIAGALQYINGATSAADQLNRTTKALQSFQTMDKAGTPPVTRKQMCEELWAKDGMNVPGHSLEKFSNADLKAKYDQINGLRYVPGDHGVKLGSDRTYKMKVDDNGQLQSQKIDKKGFWSKAGDFLKKAVPIALTVASFIPGPIGLGARIGSSLYNAYQGVKNNNWVQAVAGAAGAVGKGAALMGANGVARVASTISNVAYGVQSGLDAYKNGNPAGVLGAIAGVASGVAGGLGDGAAGLADKMNRVAEWARRGSQAVGAIEAARDGDWLAAVGAGAGLASGMTDGKLSDRLDMTSDAAWTARGAQYAAQRGDYATAAAYLTGFGAKVTENFAPSASQRLRQISDISRTTGNVQRAVENGDYLRAAGDIAHFAAGQVNSPEAQERLGRVSDTLLTADRVQHAIERKDYLGAANQALGLAGRLSDNDQVQMASRLLDRTDNLKRAIDSGDPQAIGNAIGNLGWAVRDACQELSQRNETSAQAELEPVDGQTAVDPAKLGALSTADQERLASFASGDAGKQAQQGYSLVTSNDAFKGLPADAQARVLGSLARSDDPRNDGMKLQQLLGSEGFQALDGGQQARLLDVFDGMGWDGRNQLGKLAERSVGGVPALLDRDSQGNTLLDSLHQIATGPMDSAFTAEGVSRQNLLSSIVTEAGQPGLINQSTHGTCTVTSLQYELANRNPAEYARIMSGLVSPDGRAVMANGDIVYRVEDSVGRDKSNGRSDSERVFQAAMMDYGNGRHDYSNQDDANSRTPSWLSWLPNSSYGGLHSDQWISGMEALTGRDYGEVRGKDDIVEALSQNVPGSFAALYWGEDKKSGHAVMVADVRDGRVYFRNPHGASPHANGTELQNPPRRMEDKLIGLESMNLQDFQSWVKYAMLPQD